jgi:AcrR family transcriptional regulator
VTRRERVLEAAASLFHERGFHGVSVDQIGERAGSNGPAIYRDFKGKDELLGVLIQSAIDKVAVPRLPAFDDPWERLRYLVGHHAEFAVSNIELVSIYAHEHRALVEPWKSQFEATQRRHGLRWRKAISACYPDADPKDVAMAAVAAIGLMHSVAFWPPAALRTPDVAAKLAGLVLDGLGSLGSASSVGAGRPATNRAVQRA